MSKDIFDKLMDFLDNLEKASISYTLARYREEAVMVGVAVPGERWEIEFLRDGSVEVERFSSDGEIYGREALDELFAQYSDFDQGEDSSTVSQEIAITPVIDGG